MRERAVISGLGGDRMRLQQERADLDYAGTERGVVAAAPAESPVMLMDGDEPDQIHPAIEAMIQRQMNVSRALADQEDMSLSMIQALVKLSKQAKQYEQELAILRAGGIPTLEVTSPRMTRNGSRDEITTIAPSTRADYAQLMQQQQEKHAAEIRAFREREESLMLALQHRDDQLRDRDAVIKLLAQKMTALRNTTKAQEEALPVISIPTPPLQHYQQQQHHNQYQYHQEQHSSSTTTSSYHNALTGEPDDMEYQSAAASSLSLSPVPAPRAVVSHKPSPPTAVRTTTKLPQYSHYELPATTATTTTPTAQHMDEPSRDSPSVPRASDTLKQRKSAREARLKEIMNRIRQKTSNTTTAAATTTPRPPPIAKAFSKDSTNTDTTTTDLTSSWSFQSTSPATAAALLEDAVRRGSQEAQRQEEQEEY